MSTADEEARSKAYWDFHGHFPSNLLAAEATVIEGGVRCYLGTCAAVSDTATGQRVLIVAHTADALAKFMQAHGSKPIKEHFKAVAVVQQKVVTVVDDL